MRQRNPDGSDKDAQSKSGGQTGQPLEKPEFVEQYEPTITGVDEEFEAQEGEAFAAEGFGEAQPDQPEPIPSTLESAAVKRPSLSASPVSRLLLVANTLVFGVLVYQSGIASMITPTIQTLMAWGANSASATILNGEYWRLLTNTFVHAGFMHLVLNMYALTLIAPIVERAFGGSKLIVLYLVSGVAGSLCSIYFVPDGISVGASGAILGLFGAMISFIARFPNPQIPSALKNYCLMIVVMVVSTVLVGATFQGIDNAAHFGGLAGGFLAGWAMRTNVLGNRGWRLVEAVRTLILIVVIGFSCVYVIKKISTNPSVQAESLTLRANKLAADDKFEEASKLLDQALLLDPSNYPARCRHALACAEIGRTADALSDAKTVLSLRPKDAGAHYLRAAVFARTEHFDDAMKELDACERLGRKDGGLYNSRAWSECALGQYGEAMADIQRAIKQKPDESSFCDTLGMVLICTGKYQDALQALNRAVDLNKKDGAPYFHRAFVHFMLHEKIAAKSDTEYSHQFNYRPEQWELEKIRQLQSAAH